MSNQTECVLCPDEATMGQLCHQCLTRLLRQLDTIEQLYEESATPSYPTPGGGDGRAKTAPLPGGDDWLEYRSGTLFKTLETWTRDFAEHLDEFLPVGWMSGDPDSTPGATLHDLVLWLRRHVPAAARVHPAIPEFAEEIRSIVRAGRQAIRDVDPRIRILCPTEDGRNVCGHGLRVSVSELFDETYCRKCRTTWSTARLLVRAAHDPNAFVDVEAASLETRTPEATLRRWAKAGHIERRGNQYGLASIREYKHLKQQKTA